MVDEGRSRRSRAKEFDIILGSVSTPSLLLAEMKQTLLGASIELDGVEVEFGDIRNVITYLKPHQAIFPFHVQPKYVVHLDSVSRARRQQLEIKYGIPSGGLTARVRRADVLIVSIDGKKFLLSVKDSDSQAKLGQVSTSTRYGRGSLIGGLAGFIEPNVKIPRYFSYADTALTSEAFSKLKGQDPKFAYVKKNYPDLWADAVAQTKERAIESICALGRVFTKDKDSLITFMEKVMAGNLADSPDFYILFGTMPVNFQAAMQKLKSMKFNVTSEIYETNNKTSVLIYIELQGKKYCVTKIEPSFDGERVDKSQSKGIIYYFQQYPSSGNHYKKLLIDLSQ